MTAAAVVEFASSPPGLGPHTSFTLDRIEGVEGLYALRATDAPVRLFLLDPDTVGAHYRPPITAGVRAQIGATDDSDLRVLVVANPDDDGVYVNLRAPIVVHRATGQAAQVILEDPRYPIRERLGSAE